jgi:two-component system, chemotaxis family, chemotaxis protein CheY
MAATILIVDDSVTMRALVRHALEADGHAIVEAIHGKAALAELATTTIELVVTDVLMPEMDGLTLLQNIRADARLRNLPVLILSTEATMTVQERGRAAGATGWLVKPFHPDSLRQSVRRVLAERA